MEEGLPCYSGLIWRLAAKPQIGKDFLSNPVRHHGYGGGYRVWKNGFSVKSNRARCKPWNVPRKAGNKPGNGAGTDSKDVHGPTWTYPDPLGKPRPFQQWCPPTTMAGAGWFQRVENHLQIQPLTRNLLATALHTFSIALDVHVCQCNTENQLKCYWFSDGIFGHHNHLSLGQGRGWKSEWVLLMHPY